MVPRLNYRVKLEKHGFSTYVNAIQGRGQSKQVTSVGQLVVHHYPGGGIHAPSEMWELRMHPNTDFTERYKQKNIFDYIQGYSKDNVLCKLKGYLNR